MFSLNASSGAYGLHVQSQHFLRLVTLETFYNRLTIQRPPRRKMPVKVFVRHIHKDEFSIIDPRLGLSMPLLTTNSLEG